MTYLIQQVTIQAPPAPPARPRNFDPNELNARIEEAINRALSGTDAGQRENVGTAIREAVQDARAEIAQARAEGQSITIQPPFDPNIIPRGAVDISIAFFVMMGFVIVGLPLARAFARRMDRRGETAAASEIAPRLDRIEQAVEAIAIEVERVSEGQRYTTKAIAELRGLPGGNPAWPSGVRDGQARDGQVREPERVPVGERRP